MQLEPSFKLAFFKSKSKSKSKNESGEYTPIPTKQIGIDKNIDIFPRQNLLTDFVLNQSSSKVKKRNKRQKSFNYNQTECSFTDNINVSHQSYLKQYNSFSQTKNKGISTQLSQLANNKVNNMNKIPFQKQNKKSNQAKSNKVLFDNKLFNSKGSMNVNAVKDYLQTSTNISQGHSKSLCFPNQYDVISLENSSDNSNRSLTRNIQDKLINIRNDLLSLIQTSNDQQKQMILKEFEKIYKRIAINTISSIQDPFNEIELLKADNRNLREENKSLNKKLNSLNTKVKQMKKENEENTKTIMTRLSSIDEMKSSMQNFNKQLAALQNTSGTPNTTTNKSNSNTKAISPEKKTDNKSKNTADNINKSQHNEKKANTKAVSKDKIKTNLLDHIQPKYETEKVDTNNIIDNKEDDSLSNISLTENNMNSDFNKSALTKGISILQTNKKIQLKLPTSDFNAEFLQNYDEFSPSWRKEVDKMNQRKGK